MNASTIERIGLRGPRSPPLSPTGSVQNYLALARRAQLTGKSLGIGDAETNLLTVLEASRRLADYEWDRRAALSRSSASR